MRHVIASVLLVALGSVAVGAQAQFEVASIRPSTRTQPAPLSTYTSPDRLARAGFTLLDLVRYAFERSGFDVEGGPDWVSSARFDVTAKAEMAVTAAEMRSMTRRLLEDRFALKTHTEMRNIDVFAIVVARSGGTIGSQLKRSSLDCAPFITGAKPISESPVDESGGSLCRALTVAGGTVAWMTFRGAPLAQLAQRLQGMVRRPVFDRTGLTGAFDFDLKFTPDPAAAQRADFPSLTAALEEQLGLKLEPRRESIEVMVIDDAQPPTPN